MRSRTSIIVVIISIVIFGGVYLWYKNTNTVTGPHQFAMSTPATANSVNITEKTITDRDAQDTYQVTVVYPVLGGFPNQSAQTKINQNIYQVVQADIADFKSNLQANPDQPANDDGSNQSTLSIQYATTSDEVLGLFSITLDQSFYSAGAAHPGDQVDSYTYDMDTGKLLSLSDILTGNYLIVLSEYAKKALVVTLGGDADMSQINEGTSATDDNFDVFVPHADGLHIIFNDYQVAPYAAGVQEITIPYSALQTVINPTGPLKNFTQ